MIEDTFNKMLQEISFDLEQEKREKLIRYLEMMLEKNKELNLTAIRDPEEALEKHFIDSLILSKHIKENESKIIDLGTGAGFPGMVLAIIFPDKEFLLVDSVKKKIKFLQEISQELQIENVEFSVERAEELATVKRETFDLAVCRGVSNLRVILEYMIPFLKVKGRFLPQKWNLNEVEESKKALHILNAELVDTHKYNLPISKDERYILEIVKKSKTDKKYPRRVGIPLKNPL